MEPATITIRGTCRLTAPLQLGPLDSHLALVAGGSAAVISGGWPVPDSAWKADRPAACAGCGTVWVSTLPPGTTDSRQLYMSGERLNRTRMLFPQQTASRNEVGFVSQLASRWRHNDGAGIEMLHRGTESCNGSSFCQWAEQRVPVERTVGDTFVMTQPAFNHSVSSGTALPCYVENVFELLGQPFVRVFELRM